MAALSKQKWPYAKEDGSMTTESPATVESPFIDTLTQTYDASRKLWADALRSNQYKQGAGALRQLDVANPGEPDLFCCLGVACDLFIKAGGKLNADEPEDWTTMWNYGGHTACLPLAVRDWIGVNGNGTMADGVCLTNLNDRGMSFSDIADVIETAEFTREPGTFFG